MLYSKPESPRRTHADSATVCHRAPCSLASLIRVMADDGLSMNARNVRMLLRPGMMIKRWLGLLMLSVILLSLALAMGAAWIYRHYDVPSQLQGFVRHITLQFIPHPRREIIVFGVGVFLLGFALVRLSRSLIAPLLAREPSGRALA